MKHTLKLYLHMELDANRRPKFDVYMSDMSSHRNFGTVVSVTDVEANFDIPAKFDPVQVEVERLKKEQTKLRAEFQRALDENMARINSLLAIEHKVAA